MRCGAATLDRRQQLKALWEAKDVRRAKGEHKKRGTESRRADSDMVKWTLPGCHVGSGPLGSDGLPCAHVVESLLSHEPHKTMPDLY